MIQLTSTYSHRPVRTYTLIRLRVSPFDEVDPSYSNLFKHFGRGICSSFGGPERFCLRAGQSTLKYHATKRLYREHRFFI
jgi:hypothetical protein